MLKKLLLLLIIIVTMLTTISCSTQPVTNTKIRTYYVDSLNGSDTNSGLSENEAIQSINKVNQLPLNPGDFVLFKCGEVYRGNLTATSGSQEQRITYSKYGVGEMPIIMGSFPLSYILSDIQLVQDDIYAFMYPQDIGNLIINEGELFGVKKFSVSELTNPFDYYYDENKKVFYLKANEALINQISNKSEEYNSVEFCVTDNIVDMSNSHDVNFKNLAITNGGAHGFGGSETHRITIENCKISYMGGGFLFYREGEPVRYGNGVEVFNTGSYIDVIGCEIYEIFDTAVTNQGSQKNAYHNNFTYKNNTIYNCGMASFELWLQGKNSSMTNIVFVNNNVKNIGYGFSETQQRENTHGLGHFIADFGNRATMSNIRIENNIFADAYNEHDISSLLLVSDLIGDINEYPIYVGTINNQVSNVNYRVTYLRDGEVTFIE